MFMTRSQFYPGPVGTFSTTESVAQKTRRNTDPFIRRPETIIAVCELISHKPSRFAQQNECTFPADINCSAWRVLHSKFWFHPYKIAVVQKISQQDFVSRQATCETLLDTFPQELFSDET